MTIPTIFDWLERLSAWRGLPAASLVLVLVLIMIVIRDWRVSLLALLGQYLAAGLLFVDVLDPRLSVVKVLIGLFVCLILYVTARQVAWGRLPPDVTAAEAVQLRTGRAIRFGRYLLPTSATLRLFLALIVALVVWNLARRPAYRLPFVPADYLSLAIYALAGLGLLGLSLTDEPLSAGMGLLSFLLGFELFYASLEQSVAMLAVLAGVNLVLALTIAYLTQTRHAVAALFERDR